MLAFCISSGLSGTYNTVGSVLGDEKDLTSFVLDTRSISFGAGILAVWAAMQLEEGRGFDELKEMLPKKVKDSKVFYYMDTLTYLRKGGRIGLVTSVVGSILNIKPIISCNEDGVYYTAAKIRGAKQALSRLLSEASSFAGGRPCLTALLNGQGRGAADELKPRLIAGIPEGRLIMEKAITASLAVHTGPGLGGESGFFACRRYKPVLSAELIRQHLVKQVRVYGLCQMSVHPCFGSPYHVLMEGVGCHSYDGDGGRPLWPDWRIAWVAWYPSITGIWTSIRIKSKVSPFIRNCSTASLPSLA